MHCNRRDRYSITSSRAVSRRFVALPAERM
jgi:hypothetical protein